MVSPYYIPPDVSDEEDIVEKILIKTQWILCIFAAGIGIILSLVIFIGFYIVIFDNLLN